MGELALKSLFWVYVIALPLWLPPVVMAWRSNAIEPLQRTAAVWLAALSPLVATITVKIGTDFCRRGSTAVGLSGAHWPQCDNVAAAWLLMLAPATFMGLTAWMLALALVFDPRPRTLEEHLPPTPLTVEDAVAFKVRPAQSATVSDVVQVIVFCVFLVSFVMLAVWAST